MCARTGLVSSSVICVMASDPASPPARRWPVIPARRAPAVAFGEPVAVVPGWLLLWIEQHTDLSRVRIAHRGENPLVDDGLMRLHWTALQCTPDAPTSATASDCGSSFVAKAELPQGLDQQPLTSGEASDLIGISDRAVRSACSAGRLPARQLGGSWLIDRADALNYRTRRSA
jgi:excisionase family DNA binding protein